MDTPQGHEQNADQIAYWNGPGGARWAERQASQDVLLAPVADLLIDRAKPAPGERVIDVGCGSGATTNAFAQKVGLSGHVFGIDVSGPMLERARQVTPKDAPVTYALADATVYPFNPASFDLLASRFGVMFFADPVRSFANLRRALRPTGRLAFACWREPRENPWMMAPLQAVYQHVPKLPQMGPEDPGPFAFASEERVRRILAKRDLRTSRWNRARWRSISPSAAALTPRCKARSKSAPPAARWTAIRPRCAPPRPRRCERCWRRS
jgi:ubiquinone/menaquinone biosynthesis C-methylase UbiE